MRQSSRPVARRTFGWTPAQPRVRAVQGRRDRGARSVRRRCGGSSTRRVGEGRAERGDGEHAERDPCSQPVEHRRAPVYLDVAAAHVGHDGSEQLRATGRPGDPGRNDEDAQCIGQGAPGIPETTGQGIADDRDEDGGHGRERQQGGGGGPGDVEDPLQASGAVVATHRPG